VTTTSVDPAERVVDFLNTLDVEDDVDLLADVDDFSQWAGHPQTVDDLAEARRLRDHLRALAAGEPPGVPLSIDLHVRLDDGATLVGQGVAAEIAAAAATLAIDGRLARVKICPADDCRWAFYDRSKNHSRQWCSMEVCGNRAKARAHRARTSETAQD
jgi:predicted RNA-binding Zn ribbon-like protein